MGFFVLAASEIFLTIFFFKSWCNFVTVSLLVVVGSQFKVSLFSLLLNCLSLSLAQCSTSWITKAPLLVASISIMSFLDCGSWIDLRSLIVRLEIFMVVCFYFFWISLRVVLINVSMLWMLLVRTEFLFAGFYKIYILRKRSHYLSYSFNEFISFLLI